MTADAIHSDRLAIAADTIQLACDDLQLVTGDASPLLDVALAPVLSELHTIRRRIAALADAVADEAC